MAKKDTFSKILSIGGTGLVWFPILAPVIITIIFMIQTHQLRFDFLLPAELFLFAVVGGGLLLWASLRARFQQRLIGWGLGLAVGFLIGGQVLAVVTGLASGEIEPAGLWFTLVVASLIIYTLAVIGMGIGGVLLLLNLFTPVSEKSAA